jgi:hypothetical protein
MRRWYVYALGVAAMASAPSCAPNPSRDVSKTDKGREGRVFQAYSTSLQVAMIGGATIRNGGTLPTVAGLTFTTLTAAQVDAATLAQYDTAVLNVSSNNLGCNVNALSASAKQDLLDFVAQGKKLIIFDSECAAQDYSWMPFPFSTANPGPRGARGTLNVLEDSTLASNVSGSTYFIDAANLSNSTDAVGDMNVMTTYDPNWCVNMSGTNALGVTGPVHTYAKYPAGTDSGLIIYNGLDQDACPGNTYLVKMWTQELRQPFNPSNLPCGVTVVGITISPMQATNLVGTTHTVTATLADLQGVPQPGITVEFSVEDGPNAGSTGTAVSDANGQASFTYAGNSEGTDKIIACYTNSTGEQKCSQEATKEWVKPANVSPIASCQDVTGTTDPTSCSGAASIDDGSYDPDGNLVGCTQSPPGPYGPGTTEVVLTCVDTDGLSSSCTAQVVIADAAPPTMGCPADATVECSDQQGTLEFETTVADNCQVASSSCTYPSGSSFPVGATVDLCTAQDDAGNQASCSFTVNVHDTQPPVVTTLEPIELWPPNHTYRDFSLADCISQVVDGCDGSLDPSVAGRIVRITSDELEDDKLEDGGLGDGQTCDDIVMVDERNAKLRAERMGTGNGRVYSVFFEVTDAAGNAAAGACKVVVRHDQEDGHEAVGDTCKFCVGSGCEACPGPSAACLH